MDKQIPVSTTALADNPKADQERDDHTRELHSDLAYKRLAIVNVAFFGKANAGHDAWVLIDAGVMGSYGAIKRAAAERFGPHARPAAIVLTHGHFDHVGALEKLAEEWDVPIYAHELELPYVNGSASYPPPDPSVGGGLMATLSPMYPVGPVNVSRWLQPLPNDHTVPHMAGWRWIHVPGHTPGQVALWREGDRTLIAGDAFITTRQESAYAVAMQKPEIHGPPAYYTQNWDEARASIQKLAALEIELVVTGHGPAMQGPEMRAALRKLADNFDAIAVPEDGKYVRDPASAASGSAYRAAD